MKKIALLLACLLVLNAACALADDAAQQPVEYRSGDYYYCLLDDGTAEITDYKGWDSELTVPANLDGYAVTSIGDFAFYD